MSEITKAWVEWHKNIVTPPDEIDMYFKAGYEAGKKDKINAFRLAYKMNDKEAMEELLNA